ncbi:hypothetical protein F2Q70_00045358 [Brassica cretica]|uniref:Uncharacterized protein n=1 Tax=Brassica cretica TaxID=69181 RepID=A0A8S9KKP6_BRACR|nr:hypothetical protein F2Q70_00045358 [Brassica cretica]
MNEAHSRRNNAVAVETVVEEAMDTATEAVVVMEVMVEDFPLSGFQEFSY